MKVTVIGSGVIGTVAAYYLLEDGHEVHVIDAREGSGLETSYSNGGQLVASHGEPWAAPGTPWQMLKWLGRRDAPMILGLRADPALLAWGLKFLRNCTQARVAVNTARNLRLGLASRALIAQIRTATGIAYDGAQSGALTIYRDARGFEGAAHHAEIMGELGCPIEVADPARVLAIEPALSGIGNQIAGGLFAAEDETGDCHTFTAALAEHCAGRGVTFHYATRVERLEAEGDRIAQIRTSKGLHVADAVVLAAGPWSARLARPLGLKLPIYPVKGYALTAPLAEEAAAPRVGITDVDTNIVFARLGQRLRVVSTAEFAGFDRSLNERRIALMTDVARELLPRAADYAQQEPWSGLRPVTPDHVPILGPTRFRNLWLDTGHGTLGWTQACASGRAVASLVAGRDPGIDMAGLTLDRF